MKNSLDNLFRWAYRFCREKAITRCVLSLLLFIVFATYSQAEGWSYLGKKEGIEYFFDTSMVRHVVKNNDEFWTVPVKRIFTSGHPDIISVLVVCDPTDSGHAIKVLKYIWVKDGRVEEAQDKGDLVIYYKNDVWDSLLNQVCVGKK